MTTEPAELLIHLESADGDVVWWAESPQVPGFTAAAPTLAELRELALDALRSELSPDVEVAEVLVSDEVHVDPSGRRVLIATSDLLVA